MDMTILQLMQEYGFNRFLIGTLIYIMTGLFKIPIKMLAEKTENCAKYTKFVFFLPIIIGFGVTVLYNYFIKNYFSFTVEFVILWLSSSSLSLAMYAFVEKFIPNRKKIIESDEIKQNIECIKKLKDYLESLMNYSCVVKKETDICDKYKDRNVVNKNNDVGEKDNVEISDDIKIILRGKNE